jgi:hypothetical protein
VNLRCGAVHRVGTRLSFRVVVSGDRVVRGKVVQESVFRERAALERAVLLRVEKGPVERERVVRSGGGLVGVDRVRVGASVRVEVDVQAALASVGEVDSRGGVEVSVAGREMVRVEAALGVVETVGGREGLPVVCSVRASVSLRWGDLFASRTPH